MTTSLTTILWASHISHKTSHRAAEQTRNVHKPTIVPADPTFVTDIERGWSPASDAPGYSIFGYTFQRGIVKLLAKEKRRC
jgi:hypothetical protein